MGLRHLNLATEYRTGSIDPVSDFYVPCLGQSSRYIRAAGYFRSSILLLVGSAFLEFAKRGGKATIVCSPDLEPGDISALVAGRETLEALVAKSVLRDVETLLADHALSPQARILATLIALECLDVRIAYRPELDGIYHEKLGCFVDGENRVTFIGSANETFRAWSTRGNYESIEVFCDWHSSRDASRTERHLTYLDRLLNNQVAGLSVVSFPEAAKERLFTKAARAFEDLEKPTERRAGGRVALPHQEAALDSWANNSHRGILKHATGSGKTFTAILAMQEHLATGQPALVLVPSQLLQSQWKKEISAAIPGASILMAGGGHTRWRESGVLRAQTSSSLSALPRVTVAVMASAASRAFLAQVTPGRHLLLIADEVHQVGSREYSEVLRVAAGKRLGLSATPERYGDLVGTETIFRYFGGVLKPEVTLRDAINAGRLVRYDYHPFSVRLTNDEAEAWRALSKRISFLLQDVGTALPEEAKRLLIRRSRIAKKAVAKIAAATRIVAENFEHGHRWIVYCEDVQHMEDLADSMRDAGIQTTMYYSQMAPDQNQTLEWFDKNGGVLLAVRCLDEGIDIPSVTHALILASSQNPRQFIQRRGRILRSHPGKESAALFDVLVLPVDNDSDPLSALEAEFVRAISFAKDARNQSAYASLIEMAAESKIDINKLFDETEGDDSDQATG